MPRSLFEDEVTDYLIKINVSERLFAVTVDVLIVRTTLTQRTFSFWQ